MGKKKRSIINVWSKIKSHQRVTDGMSDVVHDSDLEYSFTGWCDYKVNRKRRTRIGTVESPKPRIK